MKNIVRVEIAEQVYKVFARLQFHLIDASFEYERAYRRFRITASLNKRTRSNALCDFPPRHRVLNAL
jgi:hypothetical protein